MITLEHLTQLVETNIRDGKGKTECVCGQPYDPENLQIDMYSHDGGIDIAGLGRQWVYLSCECGYEKSLWKLRGGMGALYGRDEQPPEQDQRRA